MEMIYVIMCGGDYTEFRIPKQLTIINGERLVDRTIRLLKESGIDEIYISSNNPIFDSCGVQRLQHENSFVLKFGVPYGYWLDAFHPNFEPETKVTYLYGDVYYSADAIKTIVNFKSDKNVLFGTKDAKNEQHLNIGEPFAYVVNDYVSFINGIKAVKRLQDEEKLDRIAITWELYRYLNGLNINRQEVLDDTYIVIDDETIDIDTPERAEKLRGKYGAN